MDLDASEAANAAKAADLAQVTGISIHSLLDIYQFFEPCIAYLYLFVSLVNYQALWADRNQQAGT